MKKMKVYRQILFYLCLVNLITPALLHAQATRMDATGIVRNEKGNPLQGVTVVIQNSKTSFTAGTQTDTAGTFVFNKLPPGNGYNFTFSYVGYETQTLKGYELKSGTTFSLVIKLKEEDKALNDVVVVGYGTQKKVNLTGAVEQVTGKTLENRPVPNLTQGLQGVVPNLNIIMGDGKPIQAPKFNVRGTTSIGQGGNALVLIDGVEGDPSMINPNDVASVSVLKDASSAAIYGARGAFGVVLITTKNPTKDKFSITYSSSYSSKTPTTVPDMVSDGYLYSKMFNEAWTAWNDYSQTPQNVNKTVKFSQDYLAEFERRSKDPSLPKTDVNASGEYVYYENTDWYDLLYKKHTGAMEQNLSLSGNSGKASFYVTGRYYGQNGLFRYNTDDYKMYNLRAKGSIQVYPWLRIDNNTDYSSMLYHNPLNVGEGGGIWRNIADEGHPMSPLLNPDGTLSYSAAYTVGDFFYGKNGIDMNRRIIKNTTGFASSFLKDKLRVKGDFTFQNTSYDQNQIRVPVPYSRKPGVIEYVGTNTNDIQNTTQETQYLATNVYGEYETRLNRDHYFKAMAGFNYEQSTFKNLMAQRNGLIYEDAHDINLALGQAITTQGGWEKWAIMGGFYRLNYTFRDKYLLEVNGRYDGSSKFPSDQRYAFFPSVSGGWRVSKEAFWNVNPAIISDLKIRASYGSLGNGNISSYAFQEKFNISQSGRVLNGVRPQQTSQPNVLPDGLTWEKSTTENIGLDLALFGNKLKISGDAYIRKTTGMFTAGMSLPAVFGTDVPKGNYADLKTKGWELSATWKDYFMVASKPFNYSFRAVLSDYTAEVTKFNNPEQKLGDDIYYAGQKVGEIWGYVTDGFFTKDNIAEASKQKLFKASTSGQWLPGDIKFKDVNGDGVINNGDNRVNSPGDMVIIGNSTPRYAYGFNIDLDWSNFFFGAFIQGVGKQQWWPGAESDVFWGQYNRPYNLLPKSQLGNIWSEENPNTYFPRYRGYSAQSGGGELTTKQTKYLQNIAYTRIKNIQLGYILPQRLISKIKMQAARVYLSGENLFSWSPLYKVTKDLDPENTGGSDRVLTNGSNGNGNNYPLLKSVTVGLSVTF